MLLKFLREYIKVYKYKSVDYLEFKEFIESMAFKEIELLDNEEQKVKFNQIFEIDWDLWVLSSGYPPYFD